MKRPVPEITENIGGLVVMVFVILLFSLFRPSVTAASIIIHSEPALASAHAESILTLEEIVERAQKYHPDVIDARTTLEAMERELIEKETAFTPTLSLETTPISFRMQRGNLRYSPSARISANQSIRSGLSTTANINLELRESTFRLPTWTVGLTYPLFRSAELNADNMGIRQAEINVELARQSVARTKAEAFIDAVSSYHSVVAARTAYVQASESLEETRKNTETVYEQVALGITSQIDRIEAETELRREELAFTQAKRTYERELDALLAIVDLPKDTTDYELAPWKHLARPHVQIVPDRIMQEARHVDADLWQKEIALETARLQLRAEQEKNRLEGSLGASVGKGEDDAEYNWNVHVRFSYPIADGGAGRRAIENQEQNVRDARRAYEREFDAVKRRLTELFDALHDAEAEADIAELVYDKTHIELEIVLAGYEHGFHSSRDVRQAERDLQRALDAWQSAILDVYVALWRIDIATGRMPGLPSFQYEEAE